MIGERRNRLHVRREALRRAQFIDVWGMDKAVHFFDDAERLVLRSVLVDTAEGALLSCASATGRFSGIAEAIW